MKTKLLLILFGLISLAKGQTAGFVNTRNTQSPIFATDQYVHLSPLDTYTASYLVSRLKDSIRWEQYSKLILFGALAPTNTIVPTSTTGIVLSNGTGTLGVTTLMQLASALGTGTTAIQNVYSAGTGLLKSGSEPNATFAINTSSVMLVKSMTDSLTALKVLLYGILNSKANSSTTLSLNGTTYSVGIGGSWSTPQLTLTGINATSISGSFPNYTISSTSQTLQPPPNLSLSGNTLSAGANSVVITSQTIQPVLLTISGNSISAGSNTIVTTETDPIWNTDKSNYYDKSSSDGRYLQTEVDGSTTNELQNLIYNSGVLSLSGVAGAISVPIPTLAINGNTLSTIGNSVVLPAQVNQSISLLGTQLSITGGNTITIPSQSLQVIPPTTLVLTSNSISTVGGNTITLPQTNIIGVGSSTVSGTFPNYTVTSSQSLQAIPNITLGTTGYSLYAVNGTTLGLPNPTISIGYSPYNGATNPNGYISGYTETDPLFDTKFTAKSTTSLTEGSNLYFTNTRARTSISLTTTGTNTLATYNSTTGILNIPQYIPISITSNTVSRSLMTTTVNSSFSISATQGFDVNYTIYTQAASALTGTNSAYIYLERSSDNSTWVTMDITGVAVSGVLSVNAQIGSVRCYLPPNYFGRLRAVAVGSNSGTAVFTYQVGTETLHQ